MRRLLLTSAILTTVIAVGIGLVCAPARRAPTQIAASPRPLVSPTVDALPVATPHSFEISVQRWQADFVAHVLDKYRYLLTDTRLPTAARGTLQQLLLQREALADPDADQLSDLAQVEQQIRDLLHPGDYAWYTRLRDADAERDSLAQYAGGISNLAPLDASQERAVFEAKLRHKDDFVTTLRDAGLDRRPFASAGDDSEYNIVREAATQRVHEFLSEVQPLLTETQYIALASYESTELELELETRKADAIR